MSHRIITQSVMGGSSVFSHASLSSGQLRYVAVLSTDTQLFSFVEIATVTKKVKRVINIDEHGCKYINIAGKKYPVWMIDCDLQEAQIPCIYVDNVDSIPTRGNPKGNGGNNAKFGCKTKRVRVPEYWSQETIDHLPDLFNLLQVYKQSCKESPTSPRYQQLRNLLSEIERLGY